MAARSYEWPEGLYPLRAWLKNQGVDVDHLKSERQVLFLGKRLSNMKGKLPPRQADLFPLLLKLQTQHPHLRARLPQKSAEIRRPDSVAGTFGPASAVRHVNVADYLASKECLNDDCTSLLSSI